MDQFVKKTRGDLLETMLKERTLPGARRDGREERGDGIRDSISFSRKESPPTSLP